MTATQPTAPTPPQAPPRGPGARTLTVVGIVVAALLLATGSLQLLSWLVARTTTAEATLDAADVVELVADGEVRVAVGDEDALEVERVARYAWVAPRYEVTTDGGRTVVRHECATFPALHCEADLSVTVPEGTRVVVRTSDGAVRVAGAVGDVEVRAADGDASVTGAQGAVDVRGADGDVTVRDVAGGVDVEVGDGDVRVSDAGDDVRVRGRDGSAVVDGVRGDAEVRTSDGHLEVRDVRGSLAARTSDGDVLVSAVRGDVLALAADGDVTVHGTGDPVALTIATSDGRQRVEAPTDPDADVRVELRTVDGDVAYLDPQD